MMLTATTKNEETTSSGLPPAPEQPCRLFTIDEIQSATHNFDEEWCIGRGGFGKVYKGEIMYGETNICAIKRLHSLSNQGAPEFWVEVQMLSRLRHCNLVSLIGYCNDGKEMTLVYEYMPHGTLSDHLHKKGTLLSWSQRLKICIGAARGLDYLHTGTGTQHGIIHRDMKSSNILLDSNYAAKISDFGLAKICPTDQTYTHVSTSVKGSFGYMDPNYYSTGRLTRKSDVYAYGVIMLEVLCGRPALDSSLDEGLATWAQARIKQGKLTQIMDSSLRDHISNKSLKEFSRIAGRCLLGHPNQRPTMGEVICSLELALSFQERKDSSARRGIVVKKAWVLPHFEFKRRGATHTIESEGKRVDEAVSGIVNNEVDQRGLVEGEDANNDRLSTIESLPITGDAFAKGQLQGSGTILSPGLIHTIESEEIPDEAITEAFSVTEVEVDQTRLLKGKGAYYDGLPAIENLRIIGLPFPGVELHVRCLLVNGAIRCKFQWIHTLSNGSSQYIEGETYPTYTVGLGDVGTSLAVEVLPMDEKGRQGNVFKCFANDGK